MIFRSNLAAPDLTPCFALRTPPIERMGHEVPSDPDFEPACGFWTHDEAAILYTIAKSIVDGNGDDGADFVDVGSRMGWTTAHMAVNVADVWAIDPIYQDPEALARFRENALLEGEPAYHGTTCLMNVFPGTFDQFARAMADHRFDGFVIDGCHDAPEPTLDAIRAHHMAKPDAVILFHDFIGRPVRDAVRWLMDGGWKCRVYWTPNMVACCWRGLGDWRPPDHVGDPAIEWASHRAEMEMDFDFGRCE